MNTISPWTATVQADLKEANILLSKEASGYTFELCNAGDSIWITATWPNRNTMGFRAAFGLNSCFEVTNLLDDGETIVIQLGTRIGKYEIRLQFPDAQMPIFHYTTTFTPDIPLLIPFWPRDITPLTAKGSVENTSGKIYAHQVGARSGLLFATATRPKAGSVFYFQNLTALCHYCSATETSLAETVGGSWPEIGFQLPVTDSNPLPAKENYTISDAYVLLSEENPESDIEITQQFLNHLATIYAHLPKPQTKYHDWQHIGSKAISDLCDNKGCWTQSQGIPYLNAYVADYQTPAELMVQLAVLLPVTEYLKWSGDKHKISNLLNSGLEAFYDNKLKTMMRWLPSLVDDLDKSEEQKRDRIMDSWYLHHPLMNLARLALDGDKIAEKLLLDSIGYAIKVAHHFKYEWPVFYKMDTLEVNKKEIAPGEGGETDVPGSYAHLMLLVWKLTGDRKFLREAQRAVRNLAGLGLNIFYQANNTAFSAAALLELYKETNDEQYLNLSYCCLAGIFKNVHLWECNYGHAKDYSTYFAVYPLNDAPYSAAYEELEVYAALSHYLQVAEGIEILPSVKLLLSEFVRYTLNRLAYYYPPLLPEALFSDEVKTGELNKDLWIPIEDLQDGWKKSGEVGQEVYGAGLPFAIIPRQYRKIKGERFLVYCDYPISNFKTSAYKSASFKAIGDAAQECRVLIISDSKPKAANFTVTIGSGKKETAITLLKAGERELEYAVPGDSKVIVRWK